jgi:alpha-tubulin suppressor-like RCC1 family protein
MPRRPLISALFLIACGGATPDAASPNGATSSPNESKSTSTDPHAVTQMDCGDFHNCARMGDGHVTCWGRNEDGELGDGGNSDDSPTPKKVDGMSGVAQVAVGSNFSCARFTSGNVSCWGSGKILGDGKDVTKQKPSEISGLADVVDLQAGGYVVCALTSSGAVKCWGLDAVDKSNFTSGVDRIAAAGAHACVLLKNGAVKCWGEGAWSPDAKSTFANPLISRVSAISSGDSFACALSVGGIVSCFGRNEQGELGANPDEDNHIEPMNVRDLKQATAISSAESHSCAILRDRSVSCWGSNTEGELGRGTTTTQELAGPVSGMNDVEGIIAGADHVCARAIGGAVWCWGNNRYGQIGDGSKDPRLTPVKISF